jgi:hypothetical protein
MKLFRSMRWLLLALLLSVIPASSYAGVFISVNFAPPMLPVYEQPPCPEPGLMWTPGYWAYGGDGYYWVPGAWVPAPYEGALWTPGYWGWDNGLYVFHDGYWGDHVGYYGGVNYGFGYMGIGFVGGRWHGHDFEYNRAVMRFDERRFHDHFYEDRGVVDRYTVARGNRTAFSGGPGGIRHEAMPEERMAAREQHIGRTSFQQQHEMGARSDRSSYFKTNGGHPQSGAISRPLGAETHAAPGMQNQQQRNTFQNQNQPQQNQRPSYQRQNQPQQNQQQRNTFQNQNQPQQQQRPTFQNQQNQQQRGTFQNQNQPQQNQQPRPTFQNQNRPQQQQRPTFQNQQQARPSFQNQQQARPLPQAQPQQQSRPSAQPQGSPRSESKPKDH